MAVETVVRDISRHEGQSVNLRGWLYNASGKGKLLFIQLRDGTGIIQCVCNKLELGDTLFDELKHLGQESSLIVTGVVKADTRSKVGFEVHVNAATPAAAADCGRRCRGSTCPCCRPAALRPSG